MGNDDGRGGEVSAGGEVVTVEVEVEEAVFGFSSILTEEMES